jgi:uncharacterized membrane protein YoaT (DUF817 family)
MIHQISWPEFWSFVVVSFIIYYAFVTVYFYKSEIRKYLIGKYAKKKKPSES